MRTLVCDVTDEAQVQALIDAADEFGGVDVMINNAGLGGTAAITEMTDDQWGKVIDITLTGTFRCIRAASSKMIETGTRGVIVNNASVIGWRAQEGQAHYAAAKAGVMALTRCSALDVAPHGIRVNAVSPEPGDAPVPGEGDLRRAARTSSSSARRSVARPSRGRWPT